MSTIAPSVACPCGSSGTFATCCLRYLEGTPAPTAEALMRSRYTAHVVVDVDYLWNTWEKNARRDSSKDDIRFWAENSRWLSLEIIDRVQGLESDNEGIVEFIATYEADGQTIRHQERSFFKRFNSGWRYVKDIK